MQGASSNIKDFSACLPEHFFKKQEGSEFNWEDPWKNKAGCWKNKRGYWKKVEDSWKRKDLLEMSPGRSGNLQGSSCNLKVHSYSFPEHFFKNQVDPKFNLEPPLTIRSW